MSALVRIPTPLRPLCGGQDEVTVDGATVREALDDLERRHAGFKARLLDGQGGVRRFVNLFVNQDDVRHLQGLDTPLKAGDALSIVPAVAGGAPGADAAVTFSQLHQELKARVPETTARDLARARPQVLLDVRELEEVKGGKIPGAVHIPRGFLELRVEDEVPDRDAEVVVYCAGGTRSLFAADTLRRMGYQRVASLQGGFRAWAEAGQPVERPRLLTDAERRRYSRHLMIPEVGEAGQVKLLQAKVLLIGAGGLGCPAALYLAAAGVGTLGVVDFDVVDESNLQRQVLHPTDRVGTSKVESARRTLLAQNPGITVVPHEERITSENVERLLGAYDLVIDGSDNFATRYLINDACVLQRKACVHGSIYRFEGQVTVFDPARGGPCYRCLYPEPPPPELAPSCADAGVLGVLPGVVGVLEAVEAIKLILGEGEPLTGRLLTYDALGARFRELKLRRDPGCAYCASLDGAPFPGFVDYEVFCASAGGDT
ncbi:MAG: molybdopterin-synthase adenylyltransferase MoeB [Planctomycetes bacterium]|nr:molybdopterin-synthase adenylyltransferase MoeB [Planctomycetota bacterium]